MASTRLAAAAVLTATFAVGGAAQGGAEKAQAEIDAAEVKGDQAPYSRFLADNFTWTSTSGRLRDKNRGE